MKPFQGDGQLQAIMATLAEARKEAKASALRKLFCEEHAKAVEAAWHLPTKCFVADCLCAAAQTDNHMIDKTKVATSDPDHLNPAKGGNKASDDY